MDAGIMPLAGRHVLVTRPVPQGTHLCELLLEQKAITYHIPSLDIQPCAINLNFFSPEIAIFISVNAVKYYPFKLFPPSVSYFAVGAATSLALMEHGVIAQQAKQSNSEGLLDLVELKNVVNKKVAIFCGVGGRTLLQETLQDRGADCQRYEVYQRQAAISEAPRLQSLLKKMVLDYVICTSAENLLCLEQLAGAQLQSLRKTPLLVISPRIARIAKQRSFARVFTMNGSFDNKAIVQELVAIEKKNLDGEKA